MRCCSSDGGTCTSPYCQERTFSEAQQGCAAQSYYDSQLGVLLFKINMKEKKSFLDAKIDDLSTKFTGIRQYAGFRYNTRTR